MTDSRLYERLAAWDTLFLAWSRVRQNAGMPGSDGTTIDGFAADSESQIGRLRDELLTQSYCPRPFLKCPVPKKDGAIRQLSIPTIRDRVVQSAAHLVLSPVLEPTFEDSSYAYRPGRSVRTAVTKIAALRDQGYSWVVDGDIERFFDNVPHGPLLDRLGRIIGDERLVQLVGMWLAEYSDSARGLPQGSPISPLLSNFYLDSVDEAVEGNGVRLVRYADDFLVLCKSESRAKRTLERLTAILHEHGLALNSLKTRLVTFEKGFRFLGHLFVRALIQESHDSDVFRRQAPAATDPEPRNTTTERRPRRTSIAEPRKAEPQRNTPSATPIEEDLNPPTPDGSAPGLRVLYVHEKGRRITRRQDALSICDEAGRELAAFPKDRVDRVEVGPDAEIDSAALRLACSDGGHAALVTRTGRAAVLCHGFDADPGGLHLCQARHCIDPALRIELARRIVAGKLRNQRALLRRLNRRRRLSIVDASGDEIGEVLRRLDKATSVDILLGYEGNAAAKYWPALGHCLQGDWRLVTRERRPPPDPVNAVLSYLSAILARDILGLCLTKGLHPGFGALHVARDGHPALVSDLIEEFRAPVVESLAVTLFNSRALRPEMFEMGTEPTSCLLGSAGRTALVHGYERWLARKVKSPRSGYHIHWRKLVEEQVVAYVRHVRGEAPYDPYQMDY